MAGSSLIGNLAVSLSMETAAFSSGAKKAQGEATRLQKTMGGIGNSLKSFGTGLVASIGVGAIAGAVGSALEFASSLGEVAQQIGVTTGELQKYRYMATQVGVSQEEMDKSMAKLTVNLGKLQAGGKGATAAFAAIGLSADQLKGKSMDETMRLIAGKLGAIVDPAQRASAEVALFGKTGQKLDTLLAGGTAALDEMTNAYKKLGIEMSPEAIKRADDAMDTWAAKKQVFSAQFAVFVVDMLGHTEKFGAAMDTYAAAVAKNVQSLATVFKAGAGHLGSYLTSVTKNLDGLAAAPGQVAAAFVRMVNGVVSSAKALYNGVKTWLGDKLSGVWDTAKAGIHSVGEKAKWLWDVVVGHSYIPDMVDGIAAEMARLDAVMVAPATKAADATADAFKASAASIKATLDKLFPEIQQLKDDAQDMANIEASQLDPAGKSEARRRILVGDGEFDGPTAPDLGHEGETPEQVADRIRKQIEDSFKGVTDKVKLKGGDLALAIADAAQNVVGAIQNMVGAFKHGGFWDKVQGVLGVVQAGVQAYKGFGGFRAKGGPTVPGKRYIVGENGPEWFTPGRSGYIHPNNDNARGGQIIVAPSKYFDVHVQGEVVQTAQPMIRDSAVATVGQTQQVMYRRAARRIP